jgi:hypothetical protein
MKPVFMVLAMVGIYLWIRRIQDELGEAAVQEGKAEATWASEGGGNPSALV